jgi:allantoin racemase
MIRSRPDTEGAVRRLLVINPNSNPAVTALIRAAARRALSPGTIAEVINPAASPLSIETPAHRARAEPLAIDLLRGNPGYDGYVMACFDDIALEAGRRFLRAPVVGAVEASLSLARTMAERFAIVTTVETAIPGIRALLGRYGAADICEVLAAGIGVADAAGPGGEADRRVAACVRRARENGATTIILGSAGLNGRGPRLRAEFGLPVIDSIEAGLQVGEIAARHAGATAFPRGD